MHEPGGYVIDGQSRSHPTTHSQIVDDFCAAFQPRLIGGRRQWLRPGSRPARKLGVGAWNVRAGRIHGTTQCGRPLVVFEQAQLAAFVARNGTRFVRTQWATAILHGTTATRRAVPQGPVLGSHARTPSKASHGSEATDSARTTTTGTELIKTHPELPARVGRAECRPGTDLSSLQSSLGPYADRALFTGAYGARSSCRETRHPLGRFMPPVLRRRLASMGFIGSQARSSCAWPTSTAMRRGNRLPASVIPRLRSRSMCKGGVAFLQE